LSASINPGILPNAATPASHPDRRALLIQIAAVQDYFAQPESYSRSGAWEFFTED
jgi:hypothetical protein